MMMWMANRNRIALIVFLIAFLSSCASNKKLTVGATAQLLEDVARSSYKQSDLRVIREGMPAYLMLMDGMVEAWPDNECLLLAAAQAYASFASAFIDDSNADYAAMLYGRAMDYALRALVLRGFQQPRQIALNDFKKHLEQMDHGDVPYLFWAAANWGNWIGKNLRSMAAVAELPRVELMMQRVLELDETFYYGGPHLFMGIWYASRPPMAGGNLKLARQHFLQAINIGEDKFLMARIYYADYYARKTFDKQLYTSILNQALDTPADIVAELTLLNTVAHKKAQTMLEAADDFFD